MRLSPPGNLWRGIFPALAILLLVGVFPHRVEAASKDAASLFDALATYDPGQPYFPEKKWKKANSPELLGWSSEKLALARKFAGTLKTKAVVIVDNGIVVDAWGDLERRFRVHSIRKSFLSALYGIHVSEGRIRLSATLEELGIDDNPPLTPKERKARVSDLLMARSGVYHKANFETSSMRRKRPRRGSHAPGAFWYYNNWDFNALLTIFEQRTGTRIFEEFQRRISDPLAMEHFRLEDTKYQRGRSSIHPAYRFRMSALDMARFGLLYLRKGEWSGARQVIPRQWIKESTRPYSKTGSRGLFSGYGYMWWVGDKGFVAVGSGGHRLFVLPGENLVVVHRVDTDTKGGRMKSRDINRLLKKILAAKGNTNER